MKFKTATTACAVVIGITSALAGCGSSSSPKSSTGTTSPSSGSSGGSSSKTILIGNVEDLSGASSVLGIPENQGAQMAVDEINAAGGIKSLGGAKLKLVKFDTASNPDNGATETQAALAQHVVAIVGGENSNTVLTGTNISERAGVPWLNTGGTSDSILSRGYPGVFTFDFDSTEFASGWLSALDAAAKAVGAPMSMSLPYSDSSYGLEFLASMKAISNGGFSLKSSFSYPLTTTDFSTVADRAAHVGAGTIFNVGYPTDGVSLAKLWGSEFKPAGAKVVAVAGTGCSTLTGLGTTANGTLCLFTVAPGDKGTTSYYDAQYQDYMKLYKTAPIEWNGFEAVQFLAGALQKSGSTSGSALVSALHSTSLQPQQGDIYASPISFSSKGVISYWPVTVGQMEGGKAVSVFPTEYATAKIQAYGG